MDVIFVRDLFRPEDFGGNRYPWEVTRRLARRGHQVRVVTPPPMGPLPGPLEVELVTYPASRRSPLHTFATNALGARRTVDAQMRRRRPDVIVLSSYDVAYGFYAGRRRPPPSVFIYHSRFHSDAIDRLALAPWPLRLGHAPVERFRRHVEVVTFRSATRLVAVSPLSEREMSARLDGRPDRIRVIPTGVDTDVFAPGDRAEARARLGIPEGPHVLLLSARLVPVKRHHLAIRALARLRDRGRECVLVLAGRGPEEAALSVLAAAEGVADRVRFSGYVGDDLTLRDHYRAADLTLCTSTFENWSLALLESFACGTAVVGTPGGSIDDLLGLVDPGLVVTDETPDAIARAIDRWLADPGALSAVAARGRQVVEERFGWDRTTAALEQCLAEAGRERAG